MPRFERNSPQQQQVVVALKVPCERGAKIQLVADQEAAAAVTRKRTKPNRVYLDEADKTTVTAEVN